MESQRSLLFIALLVVSYLIYQQWQIDNAPAPVKTPTTQTNVDGSVSPQSGDFVPQSSDDIA